MPIIIKIDQKNSSGRLTLTSKSQFLGRSSKCQYPLSDELVSGTHLAIKISAKGHVIFKDLESTNGTLLNGESCEAGTLFIGDTLTLGSTAITIFEDGLSEFERQLQTKSDEKSMASFKLAKEIETDGIEKESTTEEINEQLTRVITLGARSFNKDPARPETGPSIKSELPQKLKIVRKVAPSRTKNQNKKEGPFKKLLSLFWKKSKKSDKEMD